ncbi:MAG: cupin domain-containing protein [Proteobacteria bacterium]|jgi:cupin 2 domain-containing protein|nr:cupin domain-containing protein [Pseudomonadota bacterium]
MTPAVRNLFTAPLPDGEGEVFQQLLEGACFRMESITSRGTPSDEGFWYDQAESEWVMLLRGEACLSFEDDGAMNLRAGDYLLIPPHRKHRVEHASNDAVWLALHFRGNDLKSDNP